jgi:hypothetical protein
MAVKAPKQLAFWLAVGGVSLIAPVLLNLAADKFPNTGIATLNNYVTRRNG